MRASLSLEEFGALGDGRTNDREAFLAACAASVARDMPIRLMAKTYVIDAPDNRGTIVRTGSGSLTIVGEGMGRSAIRIAGQQMGLDFYGDAHWRADGRDYRAARGSADRRGSIVLRDFTIGRSTRDRDQHVGPAGPKNIRITDYLDPVFERLEGVNAIGFNFQTDYCDGGFAAGCICRDAMGGAGGLRGSDGIHAYRTRGFDIHGNEASGLGDDAFSCGSGSTDFPAIDCHIYGNTANDCLGGAKLFGRVEACSMVNNRFSRMLGHGVAYYLENGTSAAYDGEDILITGNELFDCATSGAGAFASIFVYGGATTPDAVKIGREIIVAGNRIEGGRGHGIAFQIDRGAKRWRDCVINGNRIAGVGKRGISLSTFDRTVRVVDNIIRNTGDDAIFGYRFKAGSSVIIRGNSGTDIAGDGIDLTADASIHYEIESNRFADSSGVGKVLSIRHTSGGPLATSVIGRNAHDRTLSPARVAGARR